MVEIPAETVLDMYATDAVSVAPDEVLIFVAATPESMFANPMGGPATECNDPHRMLIGRFASERGLIGRGEGTEA